MSTSLRVLVVGGSGLLGGELLRQAPAEGDEVAATSSTRAGDVALRPSWILNAAYRQADWTTTADGAAHLAAAAASNDAQPRRDQAQLRSP